jgi:hypothetical protein
MKMELFGGRLMLYCRIAVLDLSQDKKTEFVTTLIGALTNEEVKDAIAQRWTVLPSSTSTIHIK